MKRKTINLFHFIEFIIISLVIVIFLLANPRTLSFLANKVTQSTGLTYKDISGNVLTNIHIKDLSFKDKQIAKDADINFNLFKLLGGKIEVDLLKIKKINIKNSIFFIKSIDKNSSSSTNTDFNLGVSLHNVYLDFLPYKKGKYNINKIILKLNNISTNDGKMINAKDLNFDISTNIWTLKSKGSLKNNIFYSKVKVKLNNKYFKKFIKDMNFNSLNPVNVVLKIDKDKLIGDLSTTSPKLFDKDFKFLKLAITKLTAHAEFAFKDLDLHFKSNIQATSKYAKKININGDFYYKKGRGLHYLGQAKLNNFRDLDANITKMLKDSKINFLGNIDGVFAKLKSQDLDVVYDSNTSYQKPKITLTSKEFLVKEFIPNFDKYITNSKFYIDAKTNLDYKNIDKTIIDYRVFSDVVDINGTYNIRKNSTNNTILKANNSRIKEFDKNLVSKNIFPIFLNTKKRKNSLKIDLKSKYFNILANYNTLNSDFNTTINTQNLKANFKGNPKKYEYNIGFTNIKIFDEMMQNIYIHQPLGIDGEVNVIGNYKDNKYDFQTNAKWFLVNYSKNKFFYIENALLDADFQDNVLSINDYRASAYILDRYRQIFASSLSTITFLKDSVKINFLLNDAISINGDLSDNTNLTISSHNYYLNQPEAKLHLNINLLYSATKTSSFLKGSIKLLDGKVMYKVKKSHDIDDSDIIFLNKKHNKIVTNNKIFINIIAANKIKYILGKNSINLKLDLTLLKDYKKSLQLMGVVNIIDGTYFMENKKFEIGKSDLLFDGNMINPYLNLKAYYIRDPYHITILIGGKLDSPIFNFTSTPYMTQNDILSVLLFNTKASSLTNSNSNQNPALSIFGSSIAKELANNLGVKLDRVDLTTTKEGKIGFEVEKKFGKRTTIIYQNDIIQTIKVRYKNTNHIETDFTFSPESSGIDIIYKNEK